MRDRAGVARWAHNPKVGCSNHPPATKGNLSKRWGFLFMWFSRPIQPFKTGSYRPQKSKYSVFPGFLIFMGNFGLFLT